METETCLWTNTDDRFRRQALRRRVPLLLLMILERTRFTAWRSADVVDGMVQDVQDDSPVTVIIFGDTSRHLVIFAVKKDGRATM